MAGIGRPPKPPSKRRRTNKPASDTPAAWWVVGQLGEAALHHAQCDAFTGLVGVLEDVDRNPQSVLLAPARAQCADNPPVI